MPQRKISEKLEGLVRSDPDNSYIICAVVNYDNKKTGDFSQNKSLFLEYCKSNKNHVYITIDLSPLITVELKGNQVLELSTRDYIRYMVLKDEAV